MLVLIDPAREWGVCRNEPSKVVKGYSYNLFPYELLSKLLVSPLISPTVVPDIIPYITPFKEFRL